MKIFVCCSKHFYQRLDPILELLKGQNHEITLPNSFYAPFKEEEMKKIGVVEHAQWKGDMLRLQCEKVRDNDAILVVNFDKGDKKNYVGGATFLEMFKAFELSKKIFLLNPIPEGMLADELKAMQPVVLHGDVSLIK